MLNEIFEQPKVIDKLINAEKENIKRIVNIIKQKQKEFIMIAARGTSDNAAILAKYLFEIINRLPTLLAAPSVFTLYKSNLRLNKALVVGISQSGESTDVVEVIKCSKKNGALTLSITNNPESKLAKAADFNIYLHAGKEESIAATKTYTASICALSLLSFLLSDNKELVNKLSRVPSYMMRTLKLNEFINQSVTKYKYITGCAVLSRGFNYATAYEVALKLSETCYIMAQPYSVADFMHGPVAIIEKDFPIIIFMPSGITYKEMFNTVAKLKKKYPELIIISDNKQSLSLANLAIYIPIKTEEVFTPLFYIIVGQLFAYYLSKIKGLEPHKPRYLKKITRTR